MNETRRDASGKANVGLDWARCPEPKPGYRPGARASYLHGPGSNGTG